MVVVRVVEVKVVDQGSAWFKELAREKGLSSLLCGFVSLALAAMLHPVLCDEQQAHARLVDLLVQLSRDQSPLHRAVRTAIDAVHQKRAQYVEARAREFATAQERQGHLSGPLGVFELAHELRLAQLVTAPTALLRHVWQRDHTRELLAPSAGFLVERLFLEEEEPFYEEDDFGEEEEGFDLATLEDDEDLPGVHLGNAAWGPAALECVERVLKDDFGG